MFFSDAAQFYTTHILKSSPQSQATGVELSKICTFGTRPRTTRLKYITQIQTQMVNLKNTLRGESGDHVSDDVRKSLGECVPVIDSDEYYPIDDIYTLIGGLFPGTQAEMGVGKNCAIHQLASLIQIDTYISKEVCLLRPSDVIVFSQPVKLYPKFFKERRKFRFSDGSQDPYILVAIIVLSGVPEGMDVAHDIGDHYSAYIKVGGQWYKFNNINLTRQWNKCPRGKLPNGIAGSGVQNKTGNRPVMYFYLKSV